MKKSIDHTLFLLLRPPPPPPPPEGLDVLGDGIDSFDEELFTIARTLRPEDVNISVVSSLCFASAALACSPERRFEPRPAALATTGEGEDDEDVVEGAGEGEGEEVVSAGVVSISMIFFSSESWMGHQV